MKAMKPLPKSFERLLANSELPVLVDFWAPWCAPCRKVSPVVEELSQHFRGRIVTVKINVDEKQKIAQQYGIRSIPTVMLIHHGDVLMRSVGARGFEQYRREIEKKIESN